MATKGLIVDDARGPLDHGNESEYLSKLDGAIWSEKLKGASDLEISLRLLLDVGVVRRHLRAVSRPQGETAWISKHTEALSEEVSAVWRRWLDEQMPESMKTTLLLKIVTNVAVRALTPLVSSVALAGSRGGVEAARRVGQVLVDSVCDGLRRRVDGLIVDEEKESAGRTQTDRSAQGL